MAQRLEKSEVEMRRVKFKIFKQSIGIDGQPIGMYVGNTEEIDGYFHKFVDIQFSAGPVLQSETKVIIEDMDGQLHTVNLKDIQFLDKPESEQEPDTSIEPPEPESFIEG